MGTPTAMPKVNCFSLASSGFCLRCSPFAWLKMYYWQEQPQVSFLSWQKFCCNKHMLVTKHVFCHNKSMLVATKLLSWQHYVCHNKHLSRQAYFSCDKRCVLSWQTCVCWNKTFVVTKVFVVTQKKIASKLLLQQAYFCVCKNYTCGGSHQW